MALRWPEGNPIYEHSIELRCRYADTDQMGQIYHGRYAEFFETARTEMIREMGFSYARLEENGVMLPVIHLEMDFKEPIRYDELFEVHTYIFENPAVRMETWYKIIGSHDQRLKATGHVTLVFMSAQTRRPMRVPDFFIGGLGSSTEL